MSKMTRAIKSMKPDLRDMFYVQVELRIEELFREKIRARELGLDAKLINVQRLIKVNRAIFAEIKNIQNYRVLH